MKTRRISAALLAALLLFALLPAVSAAEETYVLPVFETSDIHGYLLDSAYDDAADYRYRLAYIADTVNDVRQGDSTRTLLLDGGDIYQGNVVSNLREGAPLSAAFYAMEYDAVALGNHEFDWGIEKTTDPDGTMPDFQRDGVTVENKIPILSANIYYATTGSRVTFTKDYVILNKTAVSSSGSTKTVRVAVIGYAPNYSSSIMASRIAPYTIKSSLSPIESLAKQLKSDGQADAVVLLAHEDGEDLAGDLSSSTAIDLVCGGHSHSGQAGKSRAVYIQASAKAQGYGYAELRFSGSAVSAAGQKHNYITDYDSRLRDTTANAGYLDSAVMEISRDAVLQVQDALTAVLGYTTAAIIGDAIGSNDLSSTAGNWMTDLANRATGSKVSFTNSGGIRTSLYLTNGKHYVTKGDIYTIAPFCNLLYVYDVSYATLLNILGWAARGNMGIRMSGIDCYYKNGTVNALVEDGVCLYKDGVWADGQAQKMIRISANEFIATSSGTPFSGLAVADCSLTDNESFIAVLEQEGLANDGFLYVDKTAHMIKGTYSGSLPDKTYTVTVTGGEGGAVSGGGTVSAGGSCTVTFAADEGWYIESLTVDGVKRDIPETGSMTFTNVSRDHTVQVVFAKAAAPRYTVNFIFIDDRTRYAAEFVDEGGSCSVTLFIPEGWYVSELLIDGVTREIPADGVISFTNVSRDHTVQVTYLEIPADPCAGYTDIDRAGWYHSAADFVIAQKYMGSTDTQTLTFAPAVKVSRAMVAAILYRIAGSGAAAEYAGTFSDVEENQWYTVSVEWAAREGLAAGRGDGTFDPNGNVTRQELASFLYRLYLYRKMPAVAPASLSSFPDADKVPSWALFALEWAVGCGIVSGRQSGDVRLLDPAGNAARAELASMLMRFFG